ncbi:Ig-like domain-containing protein [Paenibacillus antri]|uniref:Ig-like domain-containing protein n=1 Tax=Paenibacillus antri TaxID=2582848 RepID=UPI001EE4B2D4|nr:Ig-like domain-containing protein [Paenibacillus antri]
MTLARWPNEGTVQMGDILDPGPTRRDADLQQRGGTFKFTYDRPQYWTQADDIWLDGIFGYSWEWSYNKIANIDLENKTITLRYGEMSGIFTNWYPDFHFAQNLLEEIDMPGEYYIDRAKGVLYFLPTASFAEANPDITVTMLKTPMINAVNASHITFKDLILENGRDSAVVIMGGDGVRIEHSEIRNFSNGGVLVNTQSRWLYNDFAKATGVNHAVSYTHIHHIGGTGVTLNGGDRLTLVPGNNVVEHSHIHDFAYYHKAYNPAVILTGAGNRLSHSEIHDAPHPGILIFGNDHLVEYNDIYDVCKMFSDLGAIYMNQGHLPHERGTVIKRNYFHHIGEGKAGVEGVYPDNFTMGLVIEENIFHRMGNSAVRNNGGSHILTRNNIFVDAKVPYDYADLYLGDGPDQQINKNYMPQWIALFDKYNDFVGMPHLIKYPELADFFEENRYYPTTNTFHNNVVWNPTKARSATTNAQGAYDKFGLVQYEGNWVTNGDPGFVDWANGDLALTDNAAVFQQIPGFVNIPFHDIGIDGKAGPYLAPETIDVEGIQLYDEAVTVDMGKTRKLYAAVLPWNATNRTLQYVSGDPSVATVDANGVLKGVMPGQTTVTVSSVADPSLVDEVTVVVEVGDGILEFTDFESGRNGWPTDPNRSIVDVGGNKMYKLLRGATALNENAFSNYELTFKLKTPETIPAGVATFYIFDRQNASGSSGRIGYRKLEDGTSRWLLYNGAWATVKETVFPHQDLQPNTTYDVRVIVKGADISVYVDGVLKLKVTDPTFNASGKVGFYAGGFDYLLFDDVKFSLPTTDVAGILLNHASATVGFGDGLQLTATFDPSDAADRRLVWSSSDPGVATVDENGLVVGVGYGEADVTATSVANPNAKAVARVTVSDVLHAVDFESGAGGWPTDPNRSVVDVGGDKMYRIVNGASAHSPRTFSSYALTFRLRTPATMPEQGTFYLFDRAVGPNAGRIGYRKQADGSSQWVLYDHAWKAVRTVVSPHQDLAPNTEYEVKAVVRGGEVRLYVDGALKLEGAYAPANASGTIGFYVGGFSALWFDDIRVTALTPPVTSATLSPAAPNGANGWYTQPVQVTLAATSTTATVTQTVYSVDNGASWAPYTGPVAFDADGAYTLLYRSVDVVGLEEAVRSVELRVDVSAPALAFAEPVAAAYDTSATLTLRLAASDGASGVDPTRSAIALDGVAALEGEPIALYALPLGAHTVTATAADAAGNVAAVEATFELVATVDSLKALVARFADSGAIDNAGIANSLQAQLAGGELGAFMNHVEAQAGKHIAADAAAVLLRDAAYVLQDS